MLNLIILLSVFLMHVIFSTENKLGGDVDELTKNLFENLRADPILTGDLEFSENSKAFIDKQVQNYMNLMLKSHENSYSRSKRSSSETLPANNFVDLKPYIQIPTTSSKDIVLFQQNLVWYAACLESEVADKYGRVLKIKKFKNNTFQGIVETDIRNGVRVAAFPLTTSTIIIVAENDTTRVTLEDQTSIFMFNLDESLEVVQRINTSYSSHVAIWENERNIYMSVAQFMKKSPQGTRFEVNTPIYKWHGKHFDVIQFIATSGALKISPFSIGDVHFLSVANSRADNGDTKIYSEIWKYDVQMEKYNLLQRILTYACSDIKYFKIYTNREEDHFLIVANAYQIDIDGAVNYDTLSIIYKFVDDYFIPFQSLQVKGITEWQPIMVESGDVLLLAASKFDGIKCFQYDGWHFVESKTQVENKVTSRGIKAMHSYKFQDKTVVVIANEYDQQNMTNMLEIKSSAENELQRLHKDMLMWCLDNVNNMEETYNSGILGKPPRGDMFLEAESMSAVHGNPQISKPIKSYISELDEIEDKIQNSLQLGNSHTIDYNLTANKIVLNKNGIIIAPQIETINSLAVDTLLDNILNINEGFEIDSNVEFNLLRIEEPIFPKIINKAPVKDILHKDDDFNIANLVVNGSVNFLNPVNVSGTVNNVTIDSRSLLLRSGEQNFDNFRIKNIDVNDLETEFLNEIELKQVEGLFANMDKIKSLKELNAKNIVVGGYVNNVDIPTLQKYALKKSGNQTITKTYYFDSIEADNLKTNLLSGKNTNDLVPITGGRYTINNNVLLEKDLHVNNLTVLNYFNSIPVENGRLDILQKNSTEKQHIPGTKSFENLELLNPIKLQGKIRSKHFDIMNPAVTIESNLDLNSDVRITGNVIVEEMIKSNDIVTPNRTNSLHRARRQALKLTDPEIPIHLNFSQHITVSDLFAERINNIDPNSWVVNGAQQTQVIRGSKQFLGDLEVTGDTRVYNINDIIMAQLEENVLRRNGDQVISGKHYVKIVAAEKSIKSNNIKFGPHPWKNVITTNGHQIINGTTVFKTNLASNQTTAKRLEVKGLINALNISKIANDVATKDTTFKIFSHKKFKNITIDNLHVKNNDIISQMTPLEKNHYKIWSNIDFRNTTEIVNIYFTGKCNGVAKKDFKATYRHEDGFFIFEEDQEFEKITVHGNVFVDSNYVNDVNLTEFEINTIKIDEPFHFESATFNHIIVSDAIELDGQVENLDLDNILQNNIERPQIIIDDKVFHGNVAVEGNVNFGGLFNEFNVSDICDFSSNTKSIKDIIIEGNAYFAKGPRVREFNGYDVKNLKDSVWFRDKPTVLNGNIEFDSITFKENVTVMGLVNDANLQLLQTSYLSKSKNQTVSAHMNFLDEVFFAEDIATPKINLGREVNGININEFVKSVLLHIPQLFEDTLYFESCSVGSVQGNYLVNKLNFDNDVMRYDKTNMVTGYKEFKNLKIGNLNNDKNTKVQNVDIVNWMRKSVVTDGSSRISGKKLFKNVTLSKGLRLGLVENAECRLCLEDYETARHVLCTCPAAERTRFSLFGKGQLLPKDLDSFSSNSLKGLLNGNQFSEKTIMLKNIPQDVTGRKTFIRDTSEEIKFKALKVKGLVNNADIAELVHNQALKAGGNIFKSEIHFYNNITTKNVNIKKLYHGVNVTQLLRNISTLGALSEFTQNYRSLLEMSDEIESSLTDQAYFLHYFKPVTYVPIAKKIFGKKSYHGECEIMAFNFENGSVILNYFEWNEMQNSFVDTRGYTIKTGPHLPYIEKIELRDKDYIYLESEMDPSNNQGYTHLGRLIHFINDPNATDFEHKSFLSEGTKFIASFQLETVNHNCLLFIYFSNQINIICEGPKAEFYLLQTITSETSEKVSVINISGIPYLITTRKKAENDEPRINIWKYSNVSLQFEIYQIIYEGEPISLTSITYNCGYYLAVAYGHLQNTMNLGGVVIMRFNEQSQEFTPWQNIDLRAPTHTEFAILPSEELVLYILTDNPTEPFNVYLYEGISGFNKRITGSAIPNIINMNQFSINNKHFVVAQHYNDINIIQAIFKGEKLI